MIRKILLRFVVPLAVIGVVVWLSIRPTNERNWAEELSVLPQAHFEGDRVTIEGVRNFHWRSLDDYDARWETRSYDLTQLESLWFCLSVFAPDGWRGPAHTLLSFGFSDGRYLAVSVEARKEQGESYSVWKGMAKRFELMYVIGDERDLIANRAALRPDSVQLYPVRATPEAIRGILRDILGAANRLHERPEFYHTIFANCTTRLRDHVNDIVPGLIPASWKVLLPGYSDDLLEGLDLIDDHGLPLEEARRAFDIKKVATEAKDDPEFSRRIREAIVVPDDTLTPR